MLRRSALLGLGGALLMLPPLQGQAKAQASPAPPELPGMQLQGQARMRFLGFTIYDIRLWVEHPVDASNWQAQTLALELVYARSLRGAEIAKRSLAEMQRQAEIPPALATRWLAEMQQSFPDVTAGDRLSGLLLPAKGARFFANGQAGHLIAEPEFARLFFGIWLSERSSEPSLRAALLEGRDGRG